MITVVEIDIRNINGRLTAFPASDAALEFAFIAGKMTLSGRHLAAIARLGYVIVDQNGRAGTWKGVE